MSRIRRGNTTLRTAKSPAWRFAAKIGQEPERVFKTLVTEGKTKGLNVFVIPSNVELDLKKAAQAAGDKYIEMIKSRELEPKTGYIHGGCSPIGMKKQFPTFIDETALLFDTIYVSGGRIGLQARFHLTTSQN